MAHNPTTLLGEIEAFISRTGMGESYFGRLAAGNTELVARLRRSGRVWPETEDRVRAFMKGFVHTPSPVPAPAADQGARR